MLSQRLGKIGHVILLCESMDRMAAFYHDLLAFPVESESTTGITFRAGEIYLGLRKRTRAYDGDSNANGSPGVQIAFLVATEDIDAFHRQLVAAGTQIRDEPRDQPWGHRTLYFSDPEGNLLEIYGELSP